MYENKLDVKLVQLRAQGVWIYIFNTYSVSVYILECTAQEERLMSYQGSFSKVYW